MQVPIAQAHALVAATMAAVGHTADAAGIIADHLIDCDLRGLPFGGAARALSVAERLSASASPRRPIAVVRESAASASIDGGDNVGYLVGHQATDLAIRKAREGGVAMVGAFNTWYTGMLAYYLERIARAGLVSMAAANAPQMVAPHGGSQPRVGTNPIGFGFPTSDVPVIWDIGTSAIMHSDVTLRARLGDRLPADTAFDEAGQPTCDPQAALAGALAVWGGHKGSGLAMVVHLLGMMCGGATDPNGLRECGLFLIAVDPDVLHPAGGFERLVSEYTDSIRVCRPIDPDEKLRVPFDRSHAQRQAALARGTISIPDVICDALARVANGARMEVI